MAEVALPIILLGGMYMMSKKKDSDSDTQTMNTNEQDIRKNISNSSQHQDLGHLMMTGERMSLEGFQHNNMQPFFGAKMRGGFQGNSDSVLDTMQGAGSNYRTKEETSSFFKSMPNISYVNGTPNNNDFLQSRQTESNMKTMINPFKEMVTPMGLDTTASSNGFGGYNASMQSRHMPRTIDELRSQSNQKANHFEMNRTGPVNVQVKSSGWHAHVEKHLPDRHYENNHWGLASDSIGRMQNNPGKAIKSERLMNKSFENTIENHPQKGNSLATYAKRNYIPTNRTQIIPNREHLIPNMPHPIEDDYSKSSVRIREEVSHPEPRMGVVSSVVKALAAPVMDIIKPLQKEELILLERNPPPAKPLTMSPASRDFEITTSVTNREMFGQRIGMNYLQVSQKQTHPSRENYMLPEETTYSHTGPASGMPSTGSVDVNHQYIMRKNTTTELDRTTNGGTQIYNPNINVRLDKDGTSNERVPLGSGHSMSHGVEHIGTSYTIKEDVVENERLDPVEVESIKSNPYMV